MKKKCPVCNRVLVRVREVLDTVPDIEYYYCKLGCYTTRCDVINARIMDCDPKEVKIYIEELKKI